MPQLLPLSRAARLVGVSRGVLQRRIRDNELETFEGQVKVSDLLRVFPEVHLEDDSALERVNLIKASATYGDSDRMELPAPEVLAKRLASLSRELIEAKTELGDYSELVADLEKRLESFVRCPEGQLREQARALAAWLRAQGAQRARVPKRNTELLTKDTFLRLLAAEVKILPSGHEFFVQGTHSILEAGLQAGLSLCYGCSSGTCGSCKARVISGEVLKVRDHEYSISNSEHDLGYVLMCSYTAVTDVVLEAGEARRGSDIPPQTIAAHVSRVSRLGESLVVMGVRTPRTQRLRFLAGQDVTLTLEDGASARLALASCPCDGQNLEFHVVGRGPSAFARAVLEGGVQVGSPVTIDGPLGDFVLDEHASDPMIFLIYDEGFAPIKSLVETAIASDNAERYRLFWVVSQAGGHYMSNRCRSWTDALDNFDYTPLVLPLERVPMELDELLGEPLGELDDIERCQFYVGGPEVFVAAVRGLLAPYRIPPGAQHFQTTA